MVCFVLVFLVVCPCLQAGALLDKMSPVLVAQEFQYLKSFLVFKSNAAAAAGGATKK